MTVTPEHIAKSEGVSIDAIRARWNAKFREIPFSRFRELSAKEAKEISRNSSANYAKELRETSGEKGEEITRNFSRKNGEGLRGSASPVLREKKRVITLPPAPAAKVLPVAEPRINFRVAILNTLLVLTVLGHALLIWYDCAIQWDTPGQIGGGLAFVMVCAALLIATDPTRTRTSASALWFVALIDLGAWWVHFPTFQRPGIDDIITGTFAAFLCAASWVALYLYRDYRID